MLKYLYVGLAAALLSGCQPPAPDSVLASQTAPSAAVKKEFLRIARIAKTRPGEIKTAQISSVVLLDPQNKIYAFCVIATETKRPGRLNVNGMALRNGKVVDSSPGDDRCRDKRLRYYAFPELISMKG